MTIRISKLRLGSLILAFALFVPATAWATHVFTDVSDGAFYAAPAEWAKTNNITTGSPAGSSTFKPLDGVTRGESVTFLKRYHDNVVQPQIDTNKADITTMSTALGNHSLSIDANTSDIATNASAIAAITTPITTRYTYSGTTIATPTSAWVNQVTVGVFTKAAAGTDILLDISGNSETAGTGSTNCLWQVRVDGVSDAGNSGTAASSSDGGTVVNYYSGPWNIDALFTGLSAGAHTVQLWLRGNSTSCMNNPGNFTYTMLVTES